LFFGIRSRYVILLEFLVRAHFYHLAYQAAEKAEASAVEKAAQVRDMDGGLVVLN
jgi:hypothetical protein